MLLVSTINNYLESAHDYLKISGPQPGSQGALICSVAMEAIKLLAVERFFNLLVSSVVDAGPLKGERLFYIFAEEIVFFGLLQELIHQMQKCWNRYLLKTENLTEREEWIQQMFRVHLSAFVFAIAHLKNAHENWTQRFFQVVTAYAGGVTSGHLSERYQTFSLGILAHGFHNYLIFRYTRGAPWTVILLAILINQLSFYLLTWR